MPENIILRVEELSKHFPAGGKKRLHALDGVSFSLEKGKTLGIVGESGCGKSTCARTIIRLYEPTSGRIFLKDVDISNMNQKELRPLRRQMQMIFQDPYASLNARMTVRDIVAEPLRVHESSMSLAVIDEVVFDILDRVGLSRDHARRYAHELSGGQRQRIGIARALVLRPELVLCDEPISALDVSIQAQVVNILKGFQEELGLAYLFIAHDLAMVRYMADHVGIMYLGQLVELSDADEIYSHPLHPYTKGLLASVPIPDPTLDVFSAPPAIDGDVPSPIDPPPGCRFCARCSAAKPICFQTVPEFREVATDHKVACHLFCE